MDFIEKQLLQYGVHEGTVSVLATWIMVVFVLLLCIISNFVTKKVILKVFSRIVKRTMPKWDDILMERRLLHRLSNIVPILIIYSFAPVFPAYQAWIMKVAVLYFIVIVMIVLNTALNTADDIYRTYEVSKVKPIKGIIQVVKIILGTIGIILIVAELIGQSPMILLSGLGALSAVLMLIFRDSLLGLVAGVQLTSNDMLRVGDWIEMPKYNADGDVIDISLNTVKVMNFDKTITTIPAYALISDSYKNWRGMQDAGGRRIKRSVFIDMNSVAFCSEEMLQRFKCIHYLTDYIMERQQEIDAFNELSQVDRSNKVNGRQMTNIGVFRAYVLNYLKNHPKIHQDMTLIVRQLAPGEHGLPLEVYAFTNDTRWPVYESIQADIFDHILAVAPEFGLRIFQNPVGHDLREGLSGLRDTLMAGK